MKFTLWRMMFSTRSWESFAKESDKVGEEVDVDDEDVEEKVGEEIDVDEGVDMKEEVGEAIDVGE